MIELLVVIGIMGLMGTVAVGGYRAMQRGMEERGVVGSVNHFIRSAYQRAIMDRQPVTVYFWNETLRDETELDTVLAVGRAVAVRRGGRISHVSGSGGKDSLLVDEFGDLRFSRLVVDEDAEDGEETNARAVDATGNGMYLYKLDGGGSGFQRSIVSRSTRRCRITDTMATTGENMEIEPYAYVVIDPHTVGSWAVGDAYGFEIAEIQLPDNYIFKSTFSRSTATPVAGTTSMRFFADGGTQNDTIEISSLRPGRSGDISAQRIAVTDSPQNDLASY